jgi:hypothetical protein
VIGAYPRSLEGFGVTQSATTALNTAYAVELEDTELEAHIYRPLLMVVMKAPLKAYKEGNHARGSESVLKCQGNKSHVLLLWDHIIIDANIRSHFEP